MQKKPTYDELKKKIRDQESIINKFMANEKKFHSFFNHAGISICMIDANSGQIIEFNDVAHENLGYSREEFEKLTIYDIDGGVNKRSISKRRKEKEEGSRVFETLHRTKNGDLKNMLISYVPLQVDGKRMVQSVHIDVTANKAVEIAWRWIRRENWNYSEIL